MKKILFYLMAVAAMAASCQVEDHAPVAGVFTLNAEIPSGNTVDAVSVKTAYQAPYSVVWDADERISVIAGYQDGTCSGYEFVKGEGNDFTCSNVAEPENISALYAFYPYTAGMSFDGEYGTEGIIVGSAVSAAQQQSGTGDTGHVDGPLCGYTASVGSDGAAMQMKHLSTLFEVIVKNDSGTALNVTGITLGNSDADPMTGTFVADPVAGVLKPVENGVSGDAALTVTDGDIAAEAGSEGRFYITSAPFALPAGGILTVTVTTADGGEYVIEKQIPDEEHGKFEAGKVNHINVEIDGEVEPSYARIFVDFGITTEADRESEAPWNNIVILESQQNKDLSYSLKDENGVESGVSINLNWRSKTEEYYTSGFKTIGDIEYNGIVFPQSAFMDWIHLYNRDEGSFTIDGLNPDLEYEITTMSVRLNAASNTREMSLELKGEGEVQNSGTIHQGIKCKDVLKEGEEAQEPYCFDDDWSQFDWNNYGRVFTLRPDAEGTVTVTLKATNIYGTTKEAHLNALVITPIPPQE